VPIAELTKVKIPSHLASCTAISKFHLT